MTAVNVIAIKTTANNIAQAVFHDLTDAVPAGEEWKLVAFGVEALTGQSSGSQVLFQLVNTALGQTIPIVKTSPVLMGISTGLLYPDPLLKISNLPSGWKVQVANNSEANVQFRSTINAIRRLTA